MGGTSMTNLAGATLLITGASGFTGRHACTHFSQKGMHVVALTRDKAAWEAQGIEGTALYCDLSNEQGIRDAVARVQPDYVLHLAGQNAVRSSWQEPLHTVQVNMLGTLYLLDALRACRSSRIIVVTSKLKSSLFELFTPMHPYGFSKGLQELAAYAWGSLFDLDVVLAEPSNLIGPGPSTGICSLLAQHAVEQERGCNKGAFTLHHGHSTRDYVDVRDAVSAYEQLFVAGARGVSYEIASGVQRTLVEVVKVLNACAAVDIEVKWQQDPAVGDGDAQIALDKASERISSREASKMLEEEQAAQQSSSKPPVRSAAVLGWRRSFSFEQSIQDIMAYHQERVR